MSTAESTISQEMKLYRPEAIMGLRNRHGRPAKLFTVGSWITTLFMVATLTSVVAFLSLSSFSRKETVEGWLQPGAGSAAITFQRAGVVEAVFVREGQAVRKGQPLLKVSLDPTLDGGRTLGSRLSAANDQEAAELDGQIQDLQRSMAAQEAESLGKLEGARSQITLLTQSLGLQRQRLELDQATLVSLQTLADRGFVSKVRLREQQSQELATRQAMNDTQRQIDQSRSDILTLEATRSKGRSDAAESLAQLRGNRAALEEKRAQGDAERGIVLVAPEDGRVVTLVTSVGAAITPGATLATVLPPDARLQAELWVPSRSAGLVRDGAEVRLMYDAFPFERFGTGLGRVTSISTTPVDAKQLPIPSEGKEALFRVRVGLAAQSVTAYGRHWALAPGSRLHADLILEHQSLLEWILDPLRAVKGRGA